MICTELTKFLPLLSLKRNARKKYLKGILGGYICNRQYNWLKLANIKTKSVGLQSMYYRSDHQRSSMARNFAFFKFFDKPAHNLGTSKCYRAAEKRV